MKRIVTKWGKAIDPLHVLEEYPRPGMKRDSYVCLNGFWDYAITGSSGFPPEYDGEILVPFSPEAVLSGVNRVLTPDMFLHYRRRFSVERMDSGKRLLLHFGAVDQFCEVYVNGCRVGDHLGGYWHFSFDITGAVHEGENLLQVVVKDYSDTAYYARGKQTLERGGMWYTPQSGIWQTVWMEYVPDNYIETVRMVPDTDKGTLRIRVKMNGKQRLPLRLTILSGGEAILNTEGMTEDALRLEIPSCILWTPETPFLYDIIIRAGDDEVASYFAMRKISMEKDAKGVIRLFLNGKPYYHNGVLDQGYFPDGLYTAPSDEAMVNDILQMKALGFNMLRKHAKIEPDRWYYHCDRLGMLVWQDMVNGGNRIRNLVKTKISARFPDLVPELKRLNRDENFRVSLREDEDSRGMFAKEVALTLRQLFHFPSIVVWTVFNEAWGEFEARGITEQIRKADSSRLIDEASGWIDQGGGDIRSIHNYFLPLVVREQADRCVALSEFGGYSWHIPEHSFTPEEFGYRKYHSRSQLTFAIERLWEQELEKNLEKGLSASVYTQVSDVEDETNGLMTYDREVLKVDGKTVSRLNARLLKAFAAESMGAVLADSFR